jgi:hypothetical protein
MEGKLWEFVLVHTSLPTLAKERAIISKYEKITKAFFDVNFQNSFQTEEELPLYSIHGFERQVSIAAVFFGYYDSTSQKSQKGEPYKELRKNVCFEEKRAAGVRVFHFILKI